VNWKKCNPIWWFQNDDEPTCPADLYIGQPQWWRQLRWLLRNPMHNFTFYVIGIADKPRIVLGEYPNDVFNPNGGWKRHKVYRVRCRGGIVEPYGIGLPFVSYCGNGKMRYAGWRERGNFGLKWRSE